MSASSSANPGGKPQGFLDQVSSFPSSFWVANTMEIFERMAWYGFFALSSLYITGPKETGGLGFTSEQRGAIQAIIPFLLYLMPMLTGALADRYGYKKMFILAYTSMAVFYYLLGQFKTMSTFMVAFFMVAIAAAIFKPVVVGTVARVTNESNSRLGFGVFYMMVNVGGFFGPIVAGIVRGWDWSWMFIASSSWAVVNLIICILFYREPPRPADWKPRTFNQVLQGIADVLGNVRFFVTVMVVIVAMMVAQLGPWWFQWRHAMYFIPGWILLNFIWNAVTPPADESGNAPERPWFAQKMVCSDWRFALFLLILSGFWTSFNQIFLTMPEYIRDFSETKALVEGARFFGEGAAKAMASVDEGELYGEIDELLRKATGAEELIAGEEETKSAEEIAADNRKKLEGLASKAGNLAKSEYVSESLRQQASSIHEILSAVDQAKSDSVAAAIDGNKGAIGDIEKAEKIARYKTYPGITPEVITKLEEVAGRLGRDEAGVARVTPLDLLESCRKALEYKVRFAPVAYAETVAGIPHGGRTPSDESLEAAVTAVNKKLKDYKQPRFEGDDEATLKSKLTQLVSDHGLELDAATLASAAADLSTAHRKVTAKNLAAGWRFAAYSDPLSKPVSETRQFNPEFIVNINALGIVLFQVVVSFIIARFHQFTGMIIGMIVAAVGIGFSALAGDHGTFGAGGIGLIVCLGILIFSFGEMMASPTSQEYVGRIAPDDKKALYMGYYFVAVALGNLFGGILSGNLYAHYARDMQRPDTMWLIFSAIMLGTAVIFMIYNKFAIPSSRSDEQAATAG